MISPLSASVQIQNFMRAIKRHSKRRQPKAGTWYDAFNALEDYLETLPSDRKKVIFIDEMPWMDTQRSNFVNALETFWNGWGNTWKHSGTAGATGAQTLCSSPQDRRHHGWRTR